MSAVRVLVVEDEAALADAVARGLRREGMAVDVAATAATPWRRLATNGYDVVVLDRDLPGRPRRRRLPLADRLVAGARPRPRSRGS